MIWRRFALVVFLTAPAGLFAQLPDYTVDFSAPRGISAHPNGLYFLSADVNEICVLKSRLKGKTKFETPWMIAWYDRITFEMNDSLILAVHEKGRKARIDHVLSIHSKIYVIYSLIDQRERTSTVFAREIDKESRSLNPESKILFQMKASERIRPGSITFACSADQSKIFALGSFSRDSVNHEMTSFAVMDSSLALQWQQTIPLPYPAGLMKVQDVNVNYMGEAFVLVTLKTQHQTMPSYDILMIGKNGNSIKRYPVQMKDGFLSSVRIEMLANRELLCAGFYSIAGGSGAHGVFFKKIAIDSLRLGPEHVSEFDPQFILHDLHRRDFDEVQSKLEKGDAAELNKFLLDRIVQQSDGSVLLVGEQRYQYSITPGNYSGRYARHLVSGGSASLDEQPSRNYLGDIVVVKLNAEGQILWGTKIHKSQDTDNSHRIFSSYKILTIGGRLRLLFNDDQRNVAGFKIRNPKDFGGRKPIVVIVTVDENGEIIRELIYDSIAAVAAMSPAMSSQISEHEVILYGWRTRYEQFSRIKFK
jgi:hypothetical protein